MKISCNFDVHRSMIENLIVNSRDSAKKVLGDHIEQLNFADDPENSIKHINKFVEEITKNNIKDALEVSGNTKSIQFAIVNAAYFNGQWVCMGSFFLDLKMYNFIRFEFILLSRYHHSTKDNREFFIGMVSNRLMLK